jgi:hypothetical protein
MAVTYIKSVRIVDDSMYHGKGVVFVWVGRVTRRFARDARRFAPRRSGRLKAGIRAGTPRNPLRKSVQGTISSNAPHTMYVLRGTRGPIMSDALWALGGPSNPAAFRTVSYVDRRGNPRTRQMFRPGMLMAVGRNPWPPTNPMAIVHGQAANNFMRKAWASTAAAHPALRGAPFPIPLRAN